MALERLIGVLSVLVKANTAQYEAGMSKSARETASAAKAVKAAERDFFAMTRQIQNAGRAMQDVGRTLTVAVTLPLAAAGGLAVKTAINWESAFAGVRKTVNASAQELKGLETDLRRMATVIPVPAEKLAGIAQAAGQLGIAKQNIVGFTRVVADLSVATNLTAEQGATDLARLANITQMPQTQFSNLGSTVVALGNNFATTEQEIVAMALRLAGAGSSVGLTQAQILGLATSLSSVGIEAEAGGSAFSRVMKDMAVAVSKGGQELQNFAAIAAKGGVQNFAQLFKQDAAAAIGGFIQGLVNIRKEGGDVIGLLDKMGITEIRMSDALLRSAGAGDLVARSLSMATDAWQKNSALTAEASARYATTASRLQVLKNKVGDLAITVGGALLPAINAAIGLFDRLFPVLQKGADLFAKLPPGVQLAAVGFLGLAAAVGPTLFVLGQIVATGGAALKTLAEFGILQRALGPVAGGLASGGASATALSTLGTAASTAGAKVTALVTSTGALTAAGVVASGAVGLTLGSALLSAGDKMRGVDDGSRAAAQQIGALRGAVILGGDALGWLSEKAIAAGKGLLEAARGMPLVEHGLIPLGGAIGQVVGKLYDLTNVWPHVAKGASLLGDQFYKLGRATMYADAPLTELQLAQQAQSLADASKLAGYAVQEWGVANMLLASGLKEIPPEIARNDAAMRTFIQTLLQTKAQAGQLNAALLAALKAGNPDPGKPGGKPPDVPGVGKPSMSAEQQAKALVQVQGEIAKLQAVHRGAYASAVADIRASIATRLQEAAGVAALTGALLTLQGAQIAAAQQNFVREQLGSFQADYQQQVQNIADAVKLAQQLGKEMSPAQLQDVGAKLADLQRQGAAIPPELQAIVDRFREFEEAARAVETVNELFAEQERILGLLGPTAKEITNSFLELERSVEKRTGTEDQGILAGLDQLSEGQLETVVKQLREMQQAARAAGQEVPGLGDALGAAWRRLQDMQAGPTIIHNVGDAAAAGSAKTIEWSERVRDLAAAFQVLGIKGTSGLGQLIGGITTSMAAFQKLGDMRKWTGKSTIGNFFSGGVGNVVGNITNALGAASAAIQVGKALFGLFHKSPVEKAAEAAGKYLGQKVSEKLAQAILDDSKKLGISIQAAAALHLTEALNESGRSVASASQQVGDLFVGIKNGSIPAQQGVKQLGDLFAKAGEEAASIGKSYNGATVAMIQAARETGIALPGMAEAVAAGLDKVVAGFQKVTLNLKDGQFMGGLDPTVGVDPEQVALFARAQGELFVESFWAVVGERGLVAGADAFREQFAGMRESFKDLFPPEMLDGLLGPIDRLMELTAPGDDKGPASLFRGAAESAIGLKDILDGLAQSGYLTADSLANAGTLTQNAYQQAVAGGATEKEALLAIKPALQANLDAAAAYGLQVDDNTARLVAQSEAAGLTFKVDPMMQMVDILKSIAVALGAEIPASASHASSALGQVGQTGQQVAQTVTGSFMQVGEAVAGIGAQTSTTFNQALAEGMAQAVSTTASAAEQMAASSESGWSRIGTVSENVLDAISARLDPLRSGITVPVNWKWEGGEPPRGYGSPLPGMELPDQPEIPRAAKGLYTKASPGGSYIITGEAGRDEITAPVDAVLQRGFDAATAPLQAFGALLAEVQALRAENAATRSELARLAARPLEARVHLDGRELADSHVEQLASGNTKLAAAHQRAAQGQRKG